MTRAYLYPPRRYFEVIAAMFAGGYGLTVLHLDQDVELIGELTGQPVERLGLA